MSTSLGATICWGLKWSEETISDLFAYGCGMGQRQWSRLGPEYDELAKIAYDPKHRLLNIQDTGGGCWRRSIDVPEEVVNQLVSADWPNLFYKEKILPHFPEEFVPLIHDLDLDCYTPEFNETLRNVAGDFVDFSTLVKTEGLDAVQYRNGYFEDGPYAGWIVGREWGTFGGAEPENFDPHSMKVRGGDLQLLRVFSEKYQLPWDEPRWFVRLFGCS